MRAAIWTLVAVGLAASGPFVRSSDRQANFRAYQERLKRQMAEIED